MTETEGTAGILANDGTAELLEAELREAVRLTPELIEEEFSRIPGDLAWWTARHARAIGDALRATAKRKRLYGFFTIQAREELEQELAEAIEDGTLPPGRRKEVTAPMVESRVESFPGYQSAVEDEIAAEVERERLKGAVMALAAKRDMLIQLGANHRAELDRDPVIRERKRAATGDY